MFRSKSKQVCIKRFCRLSISWIFVSYMLCCITPQISIYKAHDDPGPLMKLWYIWYNFLWWYPAVILHFSVFWISQGSVATLIRWGRWSSYCHMCCSFLNLTVKTALKCVDFWQSYRPKNKLAPFMAHGVISQGCRWVSDGSGRLIWAPYLRLAGRGLGVHCAGAARAADLTLKL